MEVLKIKEQNALFDYLEENVGWFCTAFECKERCWFPRFFLELKFA